MIIWKINKKSPVSLLSVEHEKNGIAAKQRVLCEEEKVRLLVKNELAGVIIDRFGKDCMLMRKQPHDIKNKGELHRWCAALLVECYYSDP